MRKIVIVCVVAILTLLPVLSASCQPPTPLQNTVDAVSMLHRGCHTPDHLLQEDAVKTGEEFDVNEYFSVLTHLSMQPGYVLDYVYFYDGMEGGPDIYAREVDQTPYLTYSEYVDAEGNISPQESWTRVMDRIQVDDTAEGFFEFVVLRTMGGQFYLFWHALYNDATIICDRTGLKAALTIIDEYVIPLSSDDKRKVRSLDFQPVVAFKNNTVVVKVVIFTKWSGFIQESYTISRDFPHRILEVESKTLVELRLPVAL